jgi:hypothetical protein
VCVPAPVARAVSAAHARPPSAVCFLGICIWELVHTADAAWALVARGRWRRPQLVAAALCRLWTFAAVLGACVLLLFSSVWLFTSAPAA